jgi:hypothetical protein
MLGDDPRIGQHRGYDGEGHKVIVGWINQDGSEYLVGLTKCCGATGKGLMDEETGDGYVGCRACYQEVSWSLGCEAVLATDVNGKPC